MWLWGVGYGGAGEEICTYPGEEAAVDAKGPVSFRTILLIPSDAEALNTPPVSPHPGGCNQTSHGNTRLGQYWAPSDSKGCPHPREMPPHSRPERYPPANQSLESSKKYFERLFNSIPHQDTLQPPQHNVAGALQELIELVSRSDLSRKF